MTTGNDVERARRDGVLLGIPLGELGWFQTLLMGTATGFAAFFAATFLTIIAMLVYQTFTQRVPPYDMAYKAIGFPVGVVVLVVALGYLGAQWARRMARKSRG